MVRGSTPTFHLTIKKDGIDLSETASLYVNIKQGSKQIEFSKSELEINGNAIEFFLPQTESLQLDENIPAKIQVNWTTVDINGTVKRGATRVKEFCISEQLLKRVIT